MRILGAQALVVRFRLAEFLGGFSDAAEEKERSPGVRIVGIALRLFAQQGHPIRLIGEICVPGNSPMAECGCGIGREVGGGRFEKRLILLPFVGNQIPVSRCHQCLQTPGRLRGDVRPDL